jgi:hypothetical protein
LIGILTPRDVAKALESAALRADRRSHPNVTSIMRLIQKQ